PQYPVTHQAVPIFFSLSNNYQEDVMKTINLQINDHELAVLLGIPVHRLDYEQTLQRILEFIESPADDRCRMVVTLNVDFVVNAHSFMRHRGYPGMIDILRRAALVTPDGMPLVLLSKMLGTPLPERVTGVDLVQMIAERAALKGKSLYFLGGTPQAAQKTAEIFSSRFPGLRIAGIDTPWVSLDNTAETAALDQRICDQINAAKPDILLIGFGNPKQELWLARNVSQLKVPAAIGIGGTFNFISGEVKRAPILIQKLCMEWIYRIIQEPSRLWKRYALGLIIFGGLSFIALASSVIGIILGFAGKRQAECQLDEDTQSVVMDCRGITFCGNYLRIQILEAAHHAEKNNLKFRIANVNPILKIQLLAHRVI
ncbi:MAG: WecB/TagA/CpsF family glycosyltransferase, partial [Victivallaceae bacterium]